MTTQINGLIKQYKDGDKHALEELMLLVYKDLYLLSYSYLKDKGLAEDVVSETFLTLIQKIESITYEGNLFGYIKTIAINKSLDIIRKRKRETIGDEQLVNIQASGNSEETQSVRMALGMLEPKEREVLLLWKYGFTLHEMASNLDTTINKLRGLLGKAKKNFTIKYTALTKS